MTTYTLPFTGFDIETRPLPELVEKFTKPFPPFDEAAVKCGNLKDPVKIAEKMAQAKADHESDRVAYWKTAHERASLNPFTARVLVVGLMDEEGKLAIIEGEERAILTCFWLAICRDGDAARRWVFWSGCGDMSRKFDIDFLVTRSRILGVRIPSFIRDGRYYSRRIVDLAGEFLLHQREAYLSLTKAGELFGIYDHAPNQCFPKRDDDPVNGANFWQWWEGVAQQDVPAEEQRAYARLYLNNDLRHLLHLAPRIL